MATLFVLRSAFFVRRWPFFVLFPLLSACGPPPLAHTLSSPDAVAEAVLDGLSRRDRDRLNALAVSEQEFKNHVWPSLPAARPERNLPMGYVWGDLRQKSAGYLEATLARFGGQHYELLEVKFNGERTEYAGFQVHRETVFVVREPGGESVDLRVCGSMLVKGGQWKVLSYVTN